MLRLREMRETTDYSIKDVAQKVGVPYETYRKWEKGDSNPDWERLCLIVDALHCSVDALVGCGGQACEGRLAYICMCDQPQFIAAIPLAAIFMPLTANNRLL